MAPVPNDSRKSSGRQTKQGPSNRMQTRTIQRHPISRRSVRIAARSEQDLNLDLNNGQLTAELKRDIKEFHTKIMKGKESRNLFANSVGSAGWNTALLTYLNEVKDYYVTENQLQTWIRSDPAAFRYSREATLSTNSSDVDKDDNDDTDSDETVSLSELRSPGRTKPDLRRIVGNENQEPRIMLELDGNEIENGEPHGNEELIENGEPHEDIIQPEELRNEEVLPIQAPRPIPVPPPLPIQEPRPILAPPPLPMGELRLPPFGVPTHQLRLPSSRLSNSTIRQFAPAVIAAAHIRLPNPGGVHQVRIRIGNDILAGRFVSNVAPIPTFTLSD